MKHKTRETHVVRARGPRVRSLRASAFIHITQMLDYHLATCESRRQLLLNSLPHDLLLLLLKLLAHRRHNFRIITASDFHLTQNELLNAANTKISTNIMSSMLDTFSTRCCHLTRLDLQGITSSATCLARIVSSMSNLTSINLSSTASDDNTLQCIGQHCRKLLELHLISCTEITDTGLGFLTGHGRSNGLASSSQVTNQNIQLHHQNCSYDSSNTKTNTEDDISLPDNRREQWAVGETRLDNDDGCLKLKVVDLNKCPRITGTGLTELLQLDDLVFLRHRELSSCLQTFLSTIPDGFQFTKLRHLSYVGDITSEQFLSSLPSLPQLASLEMEIREKPWTHSSDRWAEAQHVLQNVGHKLTQLSLVHHFGKWTYEGFPLDVGDLYRMCPNMESLRLKGILLGKHIVRTTGPSNVNEGLALQHLTLEGCDGLTDATLYTLLHRAKRLRSLSIDQGPALYRDWLTDHAFQLILATNPLSSLHNVKLSGLGRITKETAKMLMAPRGSVKIMELTDCKQLPVGTL